MIATAPEGGKARARLWSAEDELTRSSASLSRLGEPLERLYREFDWAARTEHDAIRFPLRYPAPADREIAALLAACLAYGRVDLFSAQLERVLARMGPSPHRFVREFDLARDRHAFDDFRYRFNRPADLVAFSLAARRVLERWGSLGACFAAGFEAGHAHVGPALERFVSAFLDGDFAGVFPRGRPSYGYRHMFPRPSTGGACKRLHLFLRWMVRREAPDFGLWPAVPSSALLMPIDTHVEHMARAVGLTRRRSRNWRMSEEITARLRELDAADPVKFDFALCHTRMSGECLDRRDARACPPCALRPVCRHWTRHRAQTARSAPTGRPRRRP